MTDTLGSRLIILSMRAGSWRRLDISLPVRSLFSHGYVSNELCLSTVCLIPQKRRGDMGESNNYRGIASCSIIYLFLTTVMLH